MLSEEAVEHPEELLQPLFPAGITEGRIANDEVRIHAPIVPSDVQAPGGGPVLLDDVNFGQEPSDPDIVSGVLHTEDRWQTNNAGIFIETNQINKRLGRQLSSKHRISRQKRR